MFITPLQLISCIQTSGHPENLKPEHIDDIYKFIYPVLNSFVDKSIKTLSNVYGNDRESDLFYRAYSAKIDEHLKETLYTYLFKTKKWQTNTPLVLYLKKSLKHFNIYEQTNIKQISKNKFYICPVCKKYGDKSQLINFSKKIFFCSSCNEYINTTIDKINNKRYDLSFLFVYHSKKGTRCNNCKEFVPFSLQKENKLFCPFCNNECVCNKIATHPVCFSPIKTVSVDFNKKIETINCKPCVCVNFFEKKEEINFIINSLSEIISDQKKVNGRTRRSPNKEIMYQSILNVLLKNPIDIINFLINKTKADLPMHAIIFQEFSKNMLDLLPVEFITNNKHIKIYSPTDYNLKLFTSVQNFNGNINDSFILKKPTKILKERGNNKIQDDGLFSFIGYIKSITDEMGNDLFEYIDYYSFINIKFLNNKNLYYKRINVDYYAIPAHYSMLSMSHLRRILKKIYSSYIKKFTVQKDKAEYHRL